MASNKIYFYLLLCLLFTGCVLEDVEERGEICPPGHLKSSTEGRYVSFSNLDCYEDYILLSSEMSDFAKSCSECSEDEEGTGQWKCKDILTSCSDRVDDHLKKNYAHCEHYRKHGVLAEGSDVELSISFVRDYFGAVPSEDELSSLKLSSNSCPIQYDVCTYDGKYVDELNPSDIAGAYGCVQSCSGELLYCGEGIQRHCVNPKNDSDYCGAKGDCSNPNPESSSWVGKACENGMICENGDCVCGTGTQMCEDFDGCVDILHRSEHCGESCEPCGSEEVCMNGSCVPYKCDSPGLCSNDRHHCKNTVEACGESCIDCLTLPNVDKAECDDSGTCVILTCQENFHPEFNEITEVYECRKNTIEKCAPRQANASAEVQNCTEIEHSTEVACSSDGECIVKDCKAGFTVSLGQTQCVELSCAGCDDATEICFMGNCRCKAGWVSCSEFGGNCKDIINDSNNCGGCGIKCGDMAKPAHAIETGCYHAECGVILCEDHYHPYGFECELNTPENCGKHDKNCQNIENVGLVSCNEQEGKCIIVSCEQNYHIYEEICEANTPKNCNAHDRSCWVDNAEEVDCIWDEANLKAYCKTVKCAEGYHLADDSSNVDGAMKCEKDDTTNCGKTGNKCPENAECVKLAEGYDCQCNPPYDLCGPSCVDKKTDINHCGMCDNPCGGGKECINGTCQCPPDKPQICSELCVAFGTDENCSGCGDVCTNGKACVGGSCQCPSDRPNWCNNSCVAFGTNENCSGCGDVCTNGKACIGGSCQCPGDKPNWCNNSCVAFGTNENCSSCGDACTNGKTCNGTSCQCPSDKPNWCGGNCVSYGTNQNCGSCGDQCTGGQTCNGSSCQCPGNMPHWCNGSCVSFGTNENCGGCGDKCYGSTCQGGVCGCTSGTLLCSNVCVRADIQGTPMVEKDITVRATASVSASPVRYINLGERLYIYGYASSNPVFYRISDGYLNGEYVDLCEGWGRVNTQTDPLTIRSSKTYNSNNKIGLIPHGQTNVCLHEYSTNGEGGWYRVTWSKYKGYVKEQYMIETDPISPIRSVGYCP